jgi:hypothetical protein
MGFSLAGVGEAECLFGAMLELDNNVRHSAFIELADGKLGY